MADVTTTDVGLRERKKIETRRIIRAAALDLAIEDGLENLTIDAIVDRAGIARRTFFNYFDHKEDALVADTTAAAEAVRGEVVARPAEESPLHAIRAVITQRDIFALMNTDRDRMLARQKFVQQHPVLATRQASQHVHVEQALAEAVAQRMGVDTADDLRPSLIAGVAGTALRVAMKWWSAREDANLVEALNKAFDLLEQGLLTHQMTEPAIAGPQNREGGASAHE